MMLFMPAPLMAVGTGIILSFVNSGGVEQADAIITIPVAAQEGDLAVAAWQAQSTISTATGWTEIFRISPNARDFAFYYRVLGPGEGGTNADFGGGSSSNGIIAVFRPSSAISTVTPSTFNAESTFGAPADQNVLASGGEPPLIVFGLAFAGSVNNPPFTTASPAFDAEISPGTVNGRLGYSIYNSAPQDHTIGMADLTGEVGLASGYLEVA